jgi:hypothetical protein
MLSRRDLARLRHVTRRGRTDKGEREPGRDDVIIREPGRGLLWGAGMFGCTETFQSDAARLAARSASQKKADEGRVDELLEELLGNIDG